MDWHKLKMERFQAIRVVDCPDGVELPFETVEVDFDCLVTFAQTMKQLNDARILALAQKHPITLIIAFPKKSSKNYQSEINRDDVVHTMMDDGKIGGPFLVSLDQAWSGFKFKTL